MTLDNLVSSLKSLMNSAQKLEKSKKMSQEELQALADSMLSAAGSSELVSKPKKSTISQAPKTPTTPKKTHEDFIAEGHSPEEAKALSGAWKPHASLAHAAQQIRTSPDMSPAMLSKLRQHAAKYLHNKDIQEGLRAEPHLNPEKHAHSTIHVAANQLHGAIENHPEYKAFLDSDEYKSIVNPAKKKAARLQKELEIKNKDVGVQAMHQAALSSHDLKSRNKQLSEQHNAEVLQDIVHGGGAAASADPIKTSMVGAYREGGENAEDWLAAMEEDLGRGEQTSARAIAQHVGGVSEKDDEAPATNVGQTLTSKLAGNEKFRQMARKKLEQSMEKEQLDRMRAIRAAKGEKK